MACSLRFPDALFPRPARIDTGGFVVSIDVMEHPVVVVADDDALSRHVLARRLLRWGYEPETFASASEALDRLARHEHIVAHFYIKRHSWNAAVQRLNFLVEQYPNYRDRDAASNQERENRTEETQKDIRIRGQVCAPGQTACRTSGMLSIARSRTKHQYPFDGGRPGSCSRH